jgi:hypothetical protein
MIVTSYRELVCWQLSVQLRDELIAITARPIRAQFQIVRTGRRLSTLGALQHRRRIRQVGHGVSTLSGDRGRITEGAENHLDEALGREYLTAVEHQHFRRLANRAYLAAIRLSQYLRRSSPLKKSRSHASKTR